MNIEFLSDEIAVVPIGEATPVECETRRVDPTPALRRMMARLHRKGLVTDEEYRAFVALRSSSQPSELKTAVV